jgi:hypothetical protein
MHGTKIKNLEDGIWKREGNGLMYKVTFWHVRVNILQWIYNNAFYMCVLSHMSLLTL